MGQEIKLRTGPGTDAGRPLFRLPAKRPPEFFNFASDVIDHWARVRPESTALWWASPADSAGRKFTFGEISVSSRRAAQVFRAGGVRRGDRVLLMLPRIPQWWIAMLGLIRLGAVPVPATLLLTPRDVAFRVEAARISAAITSPEGTGKLEGFEGVRWATDGGAPGWRDFDRELGEAPAVFDSVGTASTDPGILYFTSATTGDPKMVMHTQASYGLGHRLTGGLWLDLAPEDVHWNISDLGWGKAAWSSFYGPWQMGACVFAFDAPGKFDPVLMLDALGHYPITTLCAPPTALRLIIRQDLSHWRFPRLRHCVAAGEPLNPEVFNIWRSATGLSLHEGYGQTETVVLVGNFRQLGREIRPGSMGRPTPGMPVELVDEALKPVPSGVEGEIALRVRPDPPLGLFQEYWRNPEEMARKFRGDFYLTGDRARMDEDGYFWFIGRKDDVIKSSGYRIGPFEVESALLEHPAVLDAAVIGKPDPLRGQLVKALVVVRAGHVGTEALKTELQMHCKNLIAAYKYPREIEFVAELPKTTSGKTRHVVLREAQEQSKRA